MKRFIEKQRQNTLPILMYLMASFFIIFIDKPKIVLLYLLFILMTYWLTMKPSTIIRVLKISFFVITIYFLIVSVLGWQMNIEIFYEFIPKGIALSILVCTGIIAFNEIPTFQLVRITKLISPWENAIYAILSGFRTFPVIFNISGKTIMALKVRGIHKNYLLSIKTYLLNMTINFFEFIFDFGNQFGAVDSRKMNLKIEYFNLKSVSFVIYLIISFGGLCYG